MKRKPNRDNDKPFSKFYKKKATEDPYDEVSYYADAEKEKRPKKQSNKKNFDKKGFGKKKFANKQSKFKKKEVPTSHEAPVEENMRLNKYIAHAGICSRRKASEHIQNGLVTVNDVVMLEMGYKVQAADVVKFQDEIVQPTRNHVYILLNKPKNVITTLHDENGRKTVLDFVSDLTKERIYPVGRLDRNTTGLLLLTNDGTFAQKLSHPSFGVKKVYKAKLDKALLPQDLEKIRQTLQLEDGPAPVDAIEYGDNNKTIGIEIHIGRNRIVRRIFEHLGYEVVKLDRVRYASLTKKNIPIGKSRFLTKQEIIILKHLS
ncbi:pseudouridine synthase [Aureispira anguillae]|uniref:Pseudouridine synthase n=1 Tax=Aureispira anguillae TaxID=2864201 RepID=A0A916DWJ2_9BACT|nr:pseudouridine synthase [Aureispira anguillae]BDS15531.1 rRNA pseudouridine synthase [Aureispira anguillae]